MHHVITGGRRVAGGLRYGPLAALLLLALGACQPMVPDQHRMVGACKFQPCVCVRHDARPVRTGPMGEVQWRQNGDPYCPEGQALAFRDHTSQIFRDQDRIVDPAPLGTYHDTSP